MHRDDNTTCITARARTVPQDGQVVRRTPHNKNGQTQLTAVGVGNLVGLIGVEPDLALADLEHTCGQALRTHTTDKTYRIAPSAQRPQTPQDSVFTFWRRRSTIMLAVRSSRHRKKEPPSNTYPRTDQRPRDQQPGKKEKEKRLQIE